MKLSREKRKLKNYYSAPRRLLCFICGKEVEQETIIIVNYALDEMICICRKHFRHYFTRPSESQISEQEF